ncbi:MAG: UbiA family prenyltransferase [Candidatus Aenigmatarchaeota archaeon]
MAITLENFKNLVLPQYLIVILFSLFSSYIVISGTLSLFLVLPFLAISFAMFALNITNNIVDIDLDKINKPKRPLPSGKMSVKEAKMLVVVCVFLSLLFSSLTNWITFVMIIVFHILSVLYSIPPLRLKRFLFADNIIGSIIYGAFPFVIAWSLLSEEFSIIFLIFFSGLIFAIASIKDLEDVKGEKEKGIDTLPIRIGVKNSILFTVSIMFVVLLMMFASSLLGMIDFIYIYPSLVSLLIWILFYVKSRKVNIEKNVITQSKIMTTSMIVVAVYYVSFALASL